MQYAFPICDDPSLIGYHITKMSFNKLGESNCLKIIINHYRGNHQKIKEISERRGTNMKVLMESYNISYTNDSGSEWNSEFVVLWVWHINDIKLNVCLD